MVTLYVFSNISFSCHCREDAYLYQFDQLFYFCVGVNVTGLEEAAGLLLVSVSQ